MSSEMGNELLQEMAQEHKENLPGDLRDTHEMGWYLDEVQRDPYVARNAHQRVYDMFPAYGEEEVEVDGETITLYDLVTEDPLHDGKNTFYGRETMEAIDEFVANLEAGARGLQQEKRIKLLLGPVGSGKTHFDEMVRQYFEDYANRDADEYAGRENGRLYTFKWTGLDVISDMDPDDHELMSPMMQDPLVLLPQKQRQKVLERANRNLEEDTPYTLRNDQDMDPLSELVMDRLMAEYDEDFSQVLNNHVEVVRLEVSENKRQGIETFEPKDKKNQDETELTGDSNYSKLGIYAESDPRSFDFSGAFCNANRGLFSGEELLKLQKEFLYDFLHASESQTIKPKNNPVIDIDQVIVGRTNMPEYRDKKNDETMEAFNDRTKRIDWKYVLEYGKNDELGGEANIYERMLNEADLPDIHVEPHTLEMAGLFAVMSRVEEPDDDGITLLDKVKAYNGDLDEEEVDLRKLRDAGKEKSEDGEGMDGLSPRFISNAIEDALMHAHKQGDSFLEPLRLFNFFEEQLPKHGSVMAEDAAKYEEYIDFAREEYEERAIDDVRRALAYDQEDLENLGNKYMDHVMAYIDNDTVTDEFSGREQNPDEKFLRSIEEELDVSEDRKDDFRQEISNWVSRRARQDKSFDPLSNDRLKTAIERKNWEDKKHNINFEALVSAQEYDDDNPWVSNLTELGYSPDGAKHVLQFAGAEVAKQEIEE